jgi:hypothetical protein
MEVNVGWDPLVPGTQNHQCICTAAEIAKDTDGDGMNDCQEKWLGTDILNPDSDKDASGNAVGDNIPDNLDYIYMMDPLFPNTSSDYDSDGFSDMQEFQTHMDPRYNDNAIRDQWAYQYLYVNQEPQNGQCWDFEVDNVSIFNTLATADHGAGDNIIELYFAQSPIDTPDTNKSFAIAKKKGSNAVWVANAVLREAEKLRATIVPDNMELIVTRNSGLTANEKVNELVEALAVAIVIVVALLTLGLGWCEALIVAVAVPVVFGLTLAVNLMLGASVASAAQTWMSR